MLSSIFILIVSFVKYSKGAVTTCIGFSVGTSSSVCTLCEPANYYSNSYAFNTQFAASACTPRTAVQNTVFYFNAGSTCTTGCDASTVAKSPTTLLQTLLYIDGVVKQYQKGSKVDIYIATPALVVNLADLGSTTEVYFFRSFQGIITIQPLYCSATVTAPCVTAGLNVKIFLQTDAFYFFVSNSMTVSNIDFDASDLCVPSGNAFGTNTALTPDCTSALMNVVPGTDLSLTPCALKTRAMVQPTNDNKIGMFNVEPLLADLDSGYTASLTLNNVNIINLTPQRSGIGYGAFIYLFSLSQSVVTLTTFTFNQGFLTNGIIFKPKTLLTYYKLTTDQSQAASIAASTSATTPLKIIITDSSFSNFNQYGIVYSTYPDLIEVEFAVATLTFTNTNFATNNMLGSKGLINLDCTLYKANCLLTYSKGTFTSTAAGYAFKFIGGNAFVVDSLTFSGLSSFVLGFSIQNTMLTISGSTFTGPSMFSGNFIIITSNTPLKSALTLKTSTFTGITTMTPNTYLIYDKTSIPGETASQLVQNAIPNNVALDTIVIDTCTFTNSNFLLANNDNFIISLSLVNSVFNGIDMIAASHTANMFNLVVEVLFNVNNVNITNLKTNYVMFAIQYGRNFTLQNMVLTSSSFNSFIYVYVIATIDPSNPIYGIMQNLSFSSISMVRPSGSTTAINIFNFPTYNKNFGIYVLNFDRLSFVEMTSEKSISDFIIFFASGHVNITNCIFKNLKQIGTLRFFSRLSVTAFQIKNTTFDYRAYTVNSIILVTSSYYIKNLTIVDTVVMGNPSLPISDASMFEFQAVGTFLMRNVSVSNLNTPTGTAISLILDNLPGILITNVNFQNNTGTSNMGADIVMEIQAQTINNAWAADVTTVNYGIQHSTFSGSSSSLTLLDNGEILIYDVTFNKLNGSGGSVLNIGSTCNVYLNKFTIQNVNASQNGGAFSMSGTSFYMYNGTLTNVKAGNKGGIFSINKNSNLFVNNVNITNTKAVYGGILFSEDSNVQISNCVFQTSSADQEGGHFFLKTTNMNLTNVQILNGTSSTAGCIFGRFSQFNFISVVMDTCTSSVDKGVGNFYMLGLPNQISSFNQFKCLNSLAMTGACMVVRNSNITFTASEFTNNTAAKQHIFDFSYTGPGQITFTTCTFKNNVGNLTITKTINTVLKYDTVTFSNNSVVSGGFLNQIEEQSLTIVNSNFQASSLGSAGSTYQFIFQLTDLSNVIVSGTNFNGLKKISFMSCSPCSSVKVDTSSFTLGFGLNGSVFQITSSQLAVNTSKFDSNLANYSGSIYSENSNLSVSNSNFQDNGAGNEGSDLSIKNQDNTNKIQYSTNVYNTTFLRFNLSSIYSMNDQISLNTVKFLTTKSQSQSRALHVGNAYTLKIQNVQILEMKGMGGIRINNENTNPTVVNISDSSFTNCSYFNSSGGSGGIIEAIGVITMGINNTLFSGGVAETSGGGIFCSGSSCNITLMSKNNFTNNQATIIGGAIYANQQPVIQTDPSTLTLSGNNASIGPNIYTFPKSIVVVSYADYLKLLGGCLQSQNNTCTISQFNTGKTMTFSTKSGQSIAFGILLLDHQNNLVSSESEAILEIQPPNSSVTLEGFYSKVSQGLAEFPKLITVGGTNSQYTLTIIYQKDTVNISQPLNVKIIPCGRGEYYSEQRCVPCPQSFYSLSYTPESSKVSECTKCEENAVCNGGDLLVPVNGFWRSTLNSSLIVKCLYGKEACPDQNQTSTSAFSYQCGPNYRGNLCQGCAPQFGKMSSGCIHCADDGLSYFLFFFKAVISLALMVFECNIAMYMGNNLTKSLLRIIFLHNAYWIIITDGGNINTSIADTLTNSFGFLNDHFSAAPKDVFNYYCFLTGLSTNNEIYKANVALQTVIPLIFGVLTFVFKVLSDLIFKKLTSSTKNKVRHLFYSLFIAIIISHRNWYPRILNSISSTFKCQMIDSNTKINYLVDNPDLVCYNDDHNLIIGAIIVPSIIMWCLTIPALTFYFIIKNKKRTWSKRETFKTIVTKKANANAKIQPKKASGDKIENEEDNVSSTSGGEKVTKRDSIFFYLVYDYKPQFYYWYVVEISVVFILSLLSQLFNEVDYTIKNMVIFVCIAILFLIYQKLQVFDLNLNNQLASLSVGVTLFSIVALLIGANEQTSDIVKQLCMVVMIILNMLFFVICILLILFKKAHHYMSKLTSMFSKKKSMKSNTVTPAKVKPAESK